MQNNCCLRWNTRQKARCYAVFSVSALKLQLHQVRKKPSFVIHCLWQKQLRLRHLWSTADSFSTRMDYSLSTFRTMAPGDNVVYLGLKELLCRGLASHNAIGLKAFFCVLVRSKRQQWSRRPKKTHDLHCADGDEQKMMRYPCHCWISIYSHCLEMNETIIAAIIITVHKMRTA